MRSQLTHCGLRHPGNGEQHVFTLLWIFIEIVEARHSVGLDPAEDRVQLLEVAFSIAPFDPADITAHVDDDALAARIVLFAEEEIGHVYTVDRTVARHFAACESSQPLWDGCHWSSLFSQAGKALRSKLDAGSTMFCMSSSVLVGASCVAQAVPSSAC